MIDNIETICYYKWNWYFFLSKINNYSFALCSWLHDCTLFLAISDLQFGHRHTLNKMARTGQTLLLGIPFAFIVIIFFLDQTAASGCQSDYSDWMLKPYCSPNCKKIGIRGTNQNMEGGMHIIYWFKQSACTALGHCPPMQDRWIRVCVVSDTCAHVAGGRVSRSCMRGHGKGGPL